MSATMPQHEAPILNKRVERCLLGTIILDGERITELAEQVRPADFGLDSHQQIFSAMLKMRQSGRRIDAVTLLEFMGEGLVREVCGAAYLASLTEGIPQNLDLGEHIRILREKAQLRTTLTIAEGIKARIEAGDLPSAVIEWAGEQYSELALSSKAGSRDWRPLFHTYEEFVNAPPLRFVIDGFAQEQGIGLIGGLAGHGKTLVMLAMAQAMLEGTPLFGCFPVTRTSDRVLYLIPESSIGPFRERLKCFRLEEHVRADRLLVHTLSAKEQVSLSDPRLLKAAEGADVFLDTAVRFMGGSENDVETARVFAQTLFGLLRAGARTITGAHHAPKGFETQERMTLENILRGSGDLGAMLSVASGLRQIDAASNRIFIENVKARDFQPCQPFIIEGRPHLDATGHFQLIAKPGEAGELRDHLVHRVGASETPGKQDKMSRVVEMHAGGKSIREIAGALGLGKSTVSRWLEESDSQVSRNCPTRDKGRDRAESDGEGEGRRSLPPSGGEGLSHVPFTRELGHGTVERVRI
jgi:hypothetical protein